VRGEHTKACGGVAGGFSAAGYELAHTWARSAIAEAMGNLGQTDIGFGLLSEAREVMERNDERYVESEIDRIRGELKLKQVSGPSSNEADVCAGEAEAEQSFVKAIEIARRRGAKSLELRAAISLSRMYLSCGRDTDAHGILQPIHDWFTEGFNCLELKAAIDILKDIDSGSKFSSDPKSQPPSLAR
jgi:hypothetical protein